MKKVIIKCKLRGRDAFEQKLSDIGLDFGPVYWQHDRVYVPRNYKKRGSFPRLIMRTEMKALDRPPRYELILRRHIEDSGVDIVNSTVIKDYTEAVNIIYQLGFEKKAEVSRQRQDLTLKGGTKLFIDNIEGTVGYYAKIEADLREDDKVGEVRDELRRTLEVLGEKNFINETYADLLVG